MDSIIETQTTTSTWRVRIFTASNFSVTEPITGVVKVALPEDGSLRLIGAKDTLLAVYAPRCWVSAEKSSEES